MICLCCRFANYLGGQRVRARICRRLAPDPKNDIVVFGEGYGVTPASNSPISGASGGQAHRIYKQLLAYLGEENVIVVTEFFTSRTDSKTHEVLCNLVAPKVCAIMMSVFARSVVL